MSKIFDNIETMFKAGLHDILSNIGVKRADAADGYLAAVECDGDSYASALTARDRAELCAIPDLAPGDFRTVRQSMRYLGGARDAAALLRALREESDAKRDRGASRDRRIGF